MKRAVFFDRDGTINEEAGYVKDLDNLVLIKGAAQAIEKVRKQGFMAILITNQSGPARGYYSEDWVNQLNNRVQDLLIAQNTKLDAIYYCPHLPNGIVPEYTKECDCRKPGKALYVQAKKDFDIDLSLSYMVGDKATDVEAGHNAGCKSVLLRTGYGNQVLDGTYQTIPNADFVADDIVKACDWIISNNS